MDATIAPAAKLAVRDLVVRRGARTIVDVPALDVMPGEVLAVIGPNGAGKTTLLLHLALLERAGSGSVLFDGLPVRGRELQLRRRMAVVLQEPLLLDRSVAANVAAGLRLRGVPRAERKPRIDRWLARFGVAALAERSSRTLSGGEAQRVSLARALALNPEVLLLDEPFSALDQPTRDALVEDLADVLSETGVTTVIVTHDRDEAARLGARVVVMMHGCIKQIGTPSDVFSAPVDEETAAFVGVETIIEARVVTRAEGLVTLAAGPHLVEAIDTGRYSAALLCLRPEDISVGPPGEHIAGSARNHLAGSITRIWLSGADARVEIDCGFRVIARVTRRSVEDMGLEAGAPVVATFKATAVHVIPK